MPSVWLVDALAGAIAGACAAIVGHPLDTMRVRMQTASSTANASASAVWAGLRGSEEGVVRALYRGVTPLTLTLSLSHALAFATNELTRRHLREALRPMGPTSSSSEDRFTPAMLGNLFAAGCASGVPVALFSTPAMFLKIQLQMSQQRDAATRPIRAMMFAAQAAVAEHGLVRGLYRGFFLQMGLDSLSRGVYFTTYEALKTELGVSCATTSFVDQHVHGHPIGHRLHLRVCTAAFSGFIMSIIISPLDVIRAQYYMSRDTCVEGVTRAIFRTQGLRGFYRGLAMTLLRSLPMTGTTLPVYDLVHDALRPVFV